MSQYTINEILDTFELPYVFISGYKKNGDCSMLRPNKTLEQIKKELPIDNPTHIVLYLKYDETSLFCIDIDDETLTNEEIHTRIKNVLGFLPPYTLSSSKKKPHYYLYIDNFDIIDFKKKVDCFKDIKADLLKDVIVEENQTDFFLGDSKDEDGFSFPSTEWKILKPLTIFNKPIENNKKPIKKIEKQQPQELVTENNNSNSNIINEYLKILNITRFNNYDLWFQLLMCCKNLNVEYSMFDALSSKCANYEASNNLKIWDSYKQNSEKLLGLGRIKEWAKEDNLDKFLEIEKKYNNFLNVLLSDANHAQLAELYSKYINNKLFYNNSRDAFISYNETNKLWTYDRPISCLCIDINEYFKLEADKYIKFYKKKLMDAKKELLTSDDKDLSDIKAKSKQVEQTLKIIEKTIKNCGNGKNPEYIIKFLKGYCWKEDDFFKKFNENPYLFAFNNGICYDFTIKSIRPINETDYLTISCGYPFKEQNTKDVDFVYKFIYNYFEDAETTKSLLSSLSCSLIGINKNEKFFVFTGRGRNGKSTLEGCISKVLGSYYTSLDIKQLTLTAKDANSATPEMAGLEFKRFVMSQEPESGKGSESLKVATIKKLTGNDPIKCRKLRQDIYEYKPQFTLYLATNDIPNLSKKDDAIKHRMKVIEFPFMFIGKTLEDCVDNIRLEDINIKTIINTEEFRYGLLWLLINIYNETEGKFYESSSISRKTNEFFCSQNPIRDWFDEYYEIDDSAKSKAEDIYKHFRETNKDYMDQKTFSMNLKELVKSKRSNGTVYLCKLKDNNDNQDCLIEDLDIPERQPKRINRVKTIN
jgi:P4 family phage/plasmid primase-like protien